MGNLKHVSSQDPGPIEVEVTADGIELVTRTNPVRLSLDAARVTAERLLAAADEAERTSTPQASEQDLQTPHRSLDALRSLGMHSQLPRRPRRPEPPTW